MNGLRVYISTNARGEKSVFYSRRADGPFYRWCYEESSGRWHFCRVHLSGMPLRELSIASWQNVPTTLQTSLVEHYLD